MDESQSNELGQFNHTIQYDDVDDKLKEKYEYAISELERLLSERDKAIKKKRDCLLTQQQQNNDLSKQIEKIRKEKANYSSELEAMSTQNKELKMILIDKDQMIEKVQSQLDSERKDSSERNHKLQKMYDDLETEWRILEDDKTNLYSQINELKSRIRCIENETETQTAELKHSLHDKYNELKKSNDKLQAEYDLIVRDTKTYTSIVDEEFEEQQQKISEIERNRRQSSSKCESLTTIIKELNNENVCLRQSENHLKTENKDLKHQLSNDEYTLQDLQRELVYFHGKMIEFEDLKQAHNILKRKYGQVVNDKYVIESELEAKQIKMQVMGIKNRELNQEKMKIVAQMDEMKNELKDKDEKHKEDLLKLEFEHLHANKIKVFEDKMKKTIQKECKAKDAPISKSIVAPLQMSKIGYFVNGDIKRSRQESMPKHDGVAVLSIHTVCGDSTHFIKTLMQKLVNIKGFVNRVWEKETTYNRNQTRGIVKLILFYDGFDIMASPDVEECINIMENEDDVVDIELTEYDYLDESERSSLSEQEEWQSITVSGSQYRLSRTAIKK